MSFEHERNSISHILMFFCSNCFILNTKNNLDKFDLKFDVEFFLIIPPLAKHIEFYNNRTLNTLS
jgi:hypothetical protein